MCVMVNKGEPEDSLLASGSVWSDDGWLRNDFVLFQICKVVAGQMVTVRLTGSSVCFDLVLNIACAHWSLHYYWNLWFYTFETIYCYGNWLDPDKTFWQRYSTKCLIFEHCAENRKSLKTSVIRCAPRLKPLFLRGSCFIQLTREILYSSSNHV